MAYFIVIGTDNNVKTVVDEIRESHLQHNVVTSGCVIDKEDGSYYNWDVYNAKGNKNFDGEKSSTSLKDAITNQIAQFKTLLPDGAIPNVFIRGSCHSEDATHRLKFVYDEVCNIGGATLSGLLLDIVLLGYDIKQPSDVTIRPRWQNLKAFQGIENGRFQTDVLYINNMDYDGAATNIDAKLLGRFLSHWSKMTCSGGVNPKQAIRSNHYAIGMAERQYNFEDLAPFFKLAAEERILDRALHDNPSASTQRMTDTKYYKDIDIQVPWIDGLCHIQKEWDNYCEYKYDYNTSASEQLYALSVQEQKLVLYLNDWLKIYCQQLNVDLDIVKREIENIESKIGELNLELADKMNAEEGINSAVSSEVQSIQKQIAEQYTILDRKKKRRDELQMCIDSNTFADSRNIQLDLSTKLLTNKQRVQYTNDLESESALFDYLHTDKAVEAVNSAVERAIKEDCQNIPKFPLEVKDNVGRLEALSIVEPTIASTIVSTSDNHQEERLGCFGKLIKLFHKDETQEVVISEEELAAQKEAQAAEYIRKLKEESSDAFIEYRKVKDVKRWWDESCELIDSKRERQEQCIQDMDGIVSNGKREGGYQVPFNRKSISLISMDKVREFRDGNSYYHEQIEKLKARYFDASTPIDGRQTMQELIKHQVIDALRGIWHTLHWDGKNPFCNELLTHEDIHNFIEDSENGMHKQSKPFVEYIKLGLQNITQNINFLFYFSHPQIEKQPNDFRSTYHVSEGTITPVYLADFTNSLCEVQVLDVTDYVDNLADFKPRTESTLHESRIDYAQHIHDISGGVTSIKDKAKTIYQWLCQNIAYDTTYQIHDADSCWRTRRGVCQAYCELFVHLAKQAGITADIVTGKTKKPDGTISSDKHSWIFVYTDGYNGILIDPTWGAGSVNAGKFVKSKDTSIWFDVSPYWMIFTHYPDEEHWTRLAISINEQQFNELPYCIPTNDLDGKDMLFEKLS